MLDQPDLGKKIVELRKAHGLTQEELVEKCRLNVRTLQRIEAGEVTPRSYTVKLIFEALQHNIHLTSDKDEDSSAEVRSVNTSIFMEVYDYVIDLFNLKTNTMKKVSILSVFIFVVSLAFVAIFSDSDAQSPEKVRKTIEASNQNFMHWFNNGKVDSLMTLFHNDACTVSNICGKAQIEAHLKQEITKYKYKKVITEIVTVTGDVAIEKGQWRVGITEGPEVAGDYTTEWHFVNKQWLIFKDEVVIKHTL